MFKNEARTHIYTSVHMHTCADPKDEEKAITNKAANPLFISPTLLTYRSK